MASNIEPKLISSLNHKYRFTIATLVTNKQEYEEMLDSYVKAGFTADCCEYIYIDNSQTNTYDAYQGINLFLQSASGEYIIITHQDVLINFDNIDSLNKRIEGINQLDAHWAILSNAGGIENNLFQRIAVTLAYADGFIQQVGKLPQKVCSVDENFILVKRSANLALSHDLSGFHLYGTDLCLIAELLGYSAYVIDFKLLHKSYGKADASFYTLLNRLISKYVRFMRGRRIITTITDFYLSSSAFNNQVNQSKLMKKVSRKLTKWATRAAERRKKDTD